MKQHIRKLNKEDHSLITNMQTGIDHDYVLRVYPDLLDRGDTIYGLFTGEELACIGGFSMIADHYAMLGRLRCDERYRGQDYATTLMNHLITEAFKYPYINWVGANTEEDNLPARRVLEKIGLTPIIRFYGATTKEPYLSGDEADTWKQITNINRKYEWLETMFIQPKTVFPYECYYPLPATHHLFEETTIKNWLFYENEDQTRMAVLKPDRKKHQYLHVVYPWSDLMEQPGLWKTIEVEYQALKQRTPDSETLIWVDLTEDDVSVLPKDHPFTLQSPWILHGVTKVSHNHSTQSEEVPMHAKQSSPY